MDIGEDNIHPQSFGVGLMTMTMILAMMVMTIMIMIMRIISRSWIDEGLKKLENGNFTAETVVEEDQQVYI